MEAVLVAVVVIVGAIAVLNLLLTFGVIRRLREHNDLLAGGASVGRGVPTMVGVGESVAPFTASAVDGSPVSSARYTRPSLVGVFGAGCQTCEEKLPIFVSNAAAFPGGREAVLAVVIAADDGEGAPYVDALAKVAVVIREDDHHGPASTALGVTGFPAFALLDANGVVLASAADPSRLPSPASEMAVSH